MTGKIFNRLNGKKEESVCMPENTEHKRKVIMLVVMFLVFSILCLHMIVKTLYGMSLNNGERLKTEQVETIKIDRQDFNDKLKNSFEHE